ncbi:tetratricopeptide repeat protein [Natrinema salifodinae]|uniref:Tfp pilus assembly protein PilF n=1 Tax=Natrinema salifodinae TaxID=1202768 RepID=A0A1I0QBD0_9EURY|nr:tetratricopeptide repeat protein [Natrinema salifodinae]SEW24139.1 Tfp pilus assembly protein PilF [Natrinema salifodinae]
MTDRDGDRDHRDHRFSEGEGFDDPYEEFDLDPPELAVDPSKVDPIDSRVVTDTLDEQNIATDDVDATELLDVGLNYMQINRYEQATEAFERTARFAEDETLEQEAWVNKGVAHAELEEWDEAIGAHREALRIDDESEHAATAETNLAYALWEFGETAQALEHAERAVEIDERFAAAWFNRAFFLSERGLSEEALHCVDNAIRLGLRNAKVLEEKAEILEELGEYDQAEEIAEEANEMREQAEREMMDDREEMFGQASGGAGGAGGGPGMGAGAGRGQQRQGGRDGIGLDDLGIDITDPGSEEERDREWELE